MQRTTAERETINEGPCLLTPHDNKSMVHCSETSQDLGSTPCQATSQDLPVYRSISAAFSQPTVSAVDLGAVQCTGDQSFIQACSKSRFSPALDCSLETLSLGHCPSRPPPVPLYLDPYLYFYSSLPSSTIYRHLIACLDLLDVNFARRDSKYKLKCLYFAKLNSPRVAFVVRLFEPSDSSGHTVVEVQRRTGDPCQLAQLVNCIQTLMVKAFRVSICDGKRNCYFGHVRGNACHDLGMQKSVSMMCAPPLLDADESDTTGLIERCNETLKHLLALAGSPLLDVHLSALSALGDFIHVHGRTVLQCDCFDQLLDLSCSGFGRIHSDRARMMLTVLSKIVHLIQDHDTRRRAVLERLKQEQIVLLISPLFLSLTKRLVREAAQLVVTLCSCDSSFFKDPKLPDVCLQMKLSGDLLVRTQASQLKPAAS